MKREPREEKTIPHCMDFHKTERVVETPARQISERGLQERVSQNKAQEWDPCTADLS
jgi:hypothetical protein